MWSACCKSSKNGLQNLLYFRIANQKSCFTSQSLKSFSPKVSCLACAALIIRSFTAKAEAGRRGAGVARPAARWAWRQRPRSQGTVHSSRALSTSRNMESFRGEKVVLFVGIKIWDESCCGKGLDY